MNYTKDQLDAINLIDGNIQIIACAGSGKTQTVARRIAHMIVSGIPKDSILAFTFTEKAANEMKLRIRAELEKHLPDDPELGSMYIGTIHAFCFQYIKEIHPEYRSYEILDEYKQLLYLSRNRNFIGIQNIPVPHKEPPFKPLLRFARSLDIAKQNRYPNDEIRRMYPEFFSAYRKYHEFLDTNKFIDFSTIVELLVNTLEGSKEELKTIREKIRYVVVDEYQDINPLQEKLINLIAGYDGNLCVVGDDDQSIFEFQGANVDNIRTFSKRYNNVTEISLMKNFRSTNLIIESARGAINYNHQRLKKKMEHGSPFRIGEKGDAYHLHFRTKAEEVDFITSKILNLRGYKHLESVDPTTGEPVYRGLDWCDFSVLIRNNSTSRDFIEAFEKANIPFTAKGSSGLFERPDIRFLQMVFNFFCDTSIYIDKDNSVQCHMPDLKRYYLTHADRGRWTTLENTLSNLKTLILKEKRFYPQDIYQDILEAMGVAESLFDEGHMYDFGRFSQLILDFETVNEWVDIKRLRSFIEFLNGHAEAKADIGGLNDPTRLNTVTIQTIHKAKGLQYPVVFIPEISKKRFPSQSRNKPPDTYLQKHDLSMYTSGEEGERRLFYVAATRSEKFLFMSSARDIGHKVMYNPSEYFDEFVHEDIIVGNTADPSSASREYTDPTPKTNLEVIPTSFSDLQYYLNCPYEYLLRKLMGFSPTIDVSFGYGQQIHNLLNRIHATSAAIPPTHSKVEQLTEDEFFLRYTRGQMFDNMKGKTKEILINYIDSYAEDFTLRLETEKPFEFILDDALISGQIDLITRVSPDSTTTDVSLIDFKTEKKDGRRERSPLNALQLRLYAIAAGRSFGVNPTDLHIHYLTDNVRAEVPISPQKLEEARNTINGAVQGIKKRQFHKSCGTRCEICDFSKICTQKN